ncbi:hypothetical protein LTR33_014615, partial [Friedmanniomyces endolithicus]
AEEEREGVKSGEEDGGAVVGTGTVDEAAGLPASAEAPVLVPEDDEKDARIGEETKADGDESATKDEESATKGEESATTGEKSATTADERTALHTEHETQPAKALSWAEEVEQAL